MDHIDRTIIRTLAGNARAPLAEIGGAAGLSPSAVNERMRRLGETGAIARFTVDVSSAALGLVILAFISVDLAAGADEEEFRRFAEEAEEVEECHHVTGRWSYLLKIRVRSLDEVESFLAALKGRRLIARSETSIALSSPVPGAYVPRGSR